MVLRYDLCVFHLLFPQACNLISIWSNYFCKLFSEISILVLAFLGGQDSDRTDQVAGGTSRVDALSDAGNRWSGIF